jgi:hypothetical protein
MKIIDNMQLALIYNWILNTLLFLSVLLFNSCATLLNSEKVKVMITTSEPSKLLVNGDSLNNLETAQYVTLSRSKKPITIIAYNDSNSKIISVKSRNSIAYWLNYYPSVHLWTGLLIDRKNPKRYTYPKLLYIDLKEKKDSYLNYVPLKSTYQYVHMIKTRPTKPFPTVNPGVELSYEMKTSSFFSTQASALYILPTYVFGIGDSFKPNQKGFGFSVEEKYYFKASAPTGSYFGFECTYLKNQYDDIPYFTPYNEDKLLRFRKEYPDTIHINRQVFDINLKLGHQESIKRLVIDLYMGLGLRNREVLHTNKVNTNDILVRPRHPNIYYAFTQEGHYWTLSIPFSLRVGWAF